VDIFDVQPDLTQPRRAIPASIRGNWQPNSADMSDFIRHWSAEAGVNLSALLNADDELEIPQDASPVRAALLRVVELARSIKTQGLVNPISVVVLDDAGYRIETGERRWLAYHLLHVLDGETWQSIPARIRDAFDPFRQAAENNQRSDLNAISRARQYALLMMALYPDEDWQPYAAFESDRAYYAQALRYDRTPQGKGTLLVNALGVKDRSIVTYCRRMLDMPDDLWQQADDENWTQDRILQVVGNSNKSVSRTSPSSWVESVRQDVARIYSKALKKSKRASVDEVEDAIRVFEQAASELREQLNRREQ
jgi:ParB-like chromosome segregation protein Spo0J